MTAPMPLQGAPAARYQGQGTPPPIRGAAPLGTESSLQGVRARAATRTRTRDTERGALSSTSAPALVNGRFRKPTSAEKTVAFRVGQIEVAESGDVAFNAAKDMLQGALKDLTDRRPAAAEAAKFHLARVLALFAVQIPEAKFELRPGLTDVEKARLFDPWGRQNGASQ